MKNGISVIMPTYNQCAFINKAILSLIGQTFTNWELILINDGSDDDTKEYINHHLTDKRIKYFENLYNLGLGKSLNWGIDISRYYNIAYLPSDDVFLENHLHNLFTTLYTEDNAILAYSGVKHNYVYSVNPSELLFSNGKINGSSLLLVQVLHKKNHLRWIERSEMVTEDLSRMFWHKLSSYGMFLPTNTVSCEWINHPKQRHKIINRNYGGGICSYREYYKVIEPINFQSISGELINEKHQYENLNQQVGQSNNPLKILIVGELSYNPERICALEEQGHLLYGLWIENTTIFYTVGPLPFGNVIDVSNKNWIENINEIKPDIIYAQLNSPVVRLAYEVMTKMPDIPFVWHFKEGPFFSRECGDWNKLIELYYRSDGQIYINELVEKWIGQYLPKGKRLSMILDGDLPKNNYFKDDWSPLLSSKDSECHTVLLGRPVGISCENIAQLAKEKIHFHLYGNYQGIWNDWIKTSSELAPNYFHVHPNVTAENWVKEFSKFDAGWLHYFESKNECDLLRLDWHDMNYPARMPPLAAAGLPMIQFDNSGHWVATDQLTRKLDIGIFFKKFDDLGKMLNDKKRMKKLNQNVLRHRSKFTFDENVPSLIEFFERVIAARHSTTQTYAK